MDVHHFHKINFAIKCNLQDSFQHFQLGQLQRNRVVAVALGPHMFVVTAGRLEDVFDPTQQNCTDRREVVKFDAQSSGQLVQVSPGSQWPFPQAVHTPLEQDPISPVDKVHEVPFALNVSEGQFGESVQTPAMSQGPVAGRHVSPVK